MTEQQKLQNAKQEIAEKYGYGNMETYLSENWTDEDVLNDVAIKYQQLCEADKWIDCKVDLPNIETRVLGHTTQKSIVISELCYCEEKILHWRDDDFNYHNLNTVTHWQTLPQPPK